MGSFNVKIPKPGMEIIGKLGTYKLAEEIGWGGNSKVFSVKVVSAEKGLPEKEEFVIKIFTANSYFGKEREKRKKRFEKEIKTVYDQIQNNIDGIIPIYDASIFLEERGNFTWYLMPRALTYNFTEIRSTEEKLKDMRDIGECIVQLHKMELVHRDIKPKNLLVYNNRVCLADFGLVRDMNENEEYLTDVNDVMGPAAIRPPEFRNIVTPKRIDYKKSDVYLFAKTVWIVLTGVKEGFYEEYRRSEKRIYLDRKRLRVETAEPLHEMLESATKHNWWDRIDIDTCVKHINDQLNIITKYVSDGAIGKWKYDETIKEIGETILPDRKVYQDMKSILEIFERMAGSVNLVFKEAEREYDPLFLKGVRIFSDNLLELDIKNIYYGRRRKIIAGIEKISIHKDFGVMNTKEIGVQADDMPIFTNLNKAFQSVEKEFYISGTYEIMFVQTGISSQ